MQQKWREIAFFSHKSAFSGGVNHPRLQIRQGKVSSHKDFQDNN